MPPTSWLPAEPAARIPLAKVAIATLAAVVAVVVANAIVFFVADAAGAMPDSVTIEDMNGDQAPIGLAAVVFVSIIATIAAGVVFAVISRVSRRPVRLFAIVATVVFVLTLYPPFTIPDIPADMIVALLAMHVVAYGVGVMTLLRVATRRG